MQIQCSATTREYGRENRGMGGREHTRERRGTGGERARQHRCDKSLLS
eukprot:CAMPEP_0182599924 /NCGR_PEP_ID=MMETSP1324-20130603/90728_1 /TAXON_ID=236786 /ORGANISM="Florenciella sp., Strain RCC1587" /LENGTH=47 /DNA_ID= /DNA_START= /DNA_END= /DNA_ORIENTATION=